jgi:hypothetical protein
MIATDLRRRLPEQACTQFDMWWCLRTRLVAARVCQRLLYRRLATSVTGSTAACGTAPLPKVACMPQGAQCPRAVG